MSEPIAVAGQRVFETFGACVAAPDDEAAARAADEALSELDTLLRAAEGSPEASDR
jgi:hypothetical protein